MYVESLVLPTLYTKNENKITNKKKKKNIPILVQICKKYFQSNLGVL